MRRSPSRRTALLLRCWPSWAGLDGQLGADTFRQSRPFEQRPDAVGTGSGRLRPTGADRTRVNFPCRIAVVTCQTRPIPVWRARCIHVSRRPASGLWGQRHASGGRGASDAHAGHCLGAATARGPGPHRARCSILRIPADANHRIVATNAVNLGKICDILADIVADDQRAGDVIRRLRPL